MEQTLCKTVYLVLFRGSSELKPVIRLKPESGGSIEEHISIIEGRTHTNTIVKYKFRLRRCGE